MTLPSSIQEKIKQEAERYALENYDKQSMSTLINITKPHTAGATAWAQECNKLAEALNKLKQEMMPGDDKPYQSTVIISRRIVNQALSSYNNFIKP